MKLGKFCICIPKAREINKLWKGDLLLLFRCHSEHSSLTIMVSKEDHSIELSNNLLVPAVLETHEYLDPFVRTLGHHLIEYDIVRPGHIFPIHILCLMSNFGLLQNDCGIEVLLKRAPKPRISDTPSLCIWILTPQPLYCLSHVIPKIVCRCTIKGISWLSDNGCITTSIINIFTLFPLIIITLFTVVLLYWVFS